MKKVYILILAALTVSFASCSLDLESEMSLSANSELAPEDVDKLLNGIYESIVRNSDNSYFFIMYSEIMSDNFKPVKFQWYQVQYAYEHKVPSDDALSSWFYSSGYKTIQRANDVINSPSASDAQKGIAYYCRALGHYMVMDIYGPIPYIKEDYNKEPIAPLSISGVYDAIIEDLKFAKENGPKFNKANPDASMFPTSEAAQALLARVLRLNGRLSEAAVEAEALINSGKFSLSPDPKDYSSEAIMVFKTLKGATNANAEWGWIMSYEARTWNCFAMADDLMETVSATDTRRALYDFDEAADRDGYIFTNKYTLDSDADLIINRIAEMYLISAEAGNANRLTEFQAARKSNLTIKQERRLELAGEFVRMNDMRMEGLTDYYIPYFYRDQLANPLLQK